MNPNELYSALEKQYFSEDMQEKDEIELLPGMLAGVQLFVDVGASIGQYSYFAGKFLKNARIVAIEADPLRYEKLCELAKEWQNATGNTYEVIHAAASDQAGNATFF